MPGVTAGRSVSGSFFVGRMLDFEFRGNYWDCPGFWSSECSGGWMVKYYCVLLLDHCKIWRNYKTCWSVEINMYSKLEVWKLNLN